jgi:hypothetical protein
VTRQSAYPAEAWGKQNIMTKILTQAAIDALKPGDKRLEISDGKLPVLRLVVQPSGARSWALRYRFKGRNAKWTIGRYPVVAVAAARIQAKLALTKVATGTDPAAEKRQARAEIRPTASRRSPPNSSRCMRPVQIG